MASSILSKPLITRLVVSVDAGRPYLFGRKQELIEKYILPKNPSYLCNKINCLSFTVFKNFKLELMKTFQIIQISLFRKRMQIHIEKKKEIHTCTCNVNDSPWNKITKITIIIVFALISSLVFARKAFGNVKTSNFVSKNSARIENFMS